MYQCKFRIVSDLPMLLETAISEISLPFSVGLSIMDLTMEQLTGLTITITTIAENLVTAAGLDFCDTGLPMNLVSLVLGK